MTYYSEVLRVLTINPTTIEEILKNLELPSTKLCYVIDALKKGIKLGTIIKYENFTEKRLYLGHKYSLP